MPAGYLVPVTIKICPDSSKGEGVFATAHVKKGTLLWQPSQVQVVPVDEITAKLAALPYDQAHVSCRWSQRSFVDMRSGIRLTQNVAGAVAAVVCGT